MRRLPIALPAVLASGFMASALVLGLTTAPSYATVSGTAGATVKCIGGRAIMTGTVTASNAALIATYGTSQTIPAGGTGAWTSNLGRSTPTGTIKWFVKYTPAYGGHASWYLTAGYPAISC